MNNRIPLYVLNNFLKFDRKIYQLFGLKLGRPLSIRFVLYMVGFGVLEIILYNLPVLGNLINWLPFGILFIIPIGLAWLLSDIGTEDRSSIAFFISFLSYQYRKLFVKRTYYRGRTVEKPRSYQFSKYYTYNMNLEEKELEDEKKVDEHESTISI